MSEVPQDPGGRLVQHFSWFSSVENNTNLGCTNDHTQFIPETASKTEMQDLRETDI